MLDRPIIESTGIRPHYSIYCVVAGLEWGRLESMQYSLVQPEATSNKVYKTIISSVSSSVSMNSKIKYIRGR